jgi:anti-sigma factor RsiW
MSGGHVHGGDECRKLLEQLSEYIDGELDLEACTAIEAHNEDCERCRAFIESLRRTVTFIQRLPRPALSEELKRELIAAYGRGRSESDS